MVYKKSISLLTPLLLFTGLSYSSFGMEQDFQLTKADCKNMCRTCDDEATNKTCATYCHKYYASSKVIKNCIDFYHMIKQSKESHRDEQKKKQEQEDANLARRLQDEEMLGFQQQQQQQREAAERQQREAAERQQREAAERQQREAAERQQREAAERRRREAAERQQREAAERQRREAAERQQREAAERQQREAAERQRREAAERQQREAGKKEKPQLQKNRPLPPTPSQQSNQQLPPPAVTHHELQERPSIIPSPIESPNKEKADENEKKPGLDDFLKGKIQNRGKMFYDDSEEEDDDSDIIIPKTSRVDPSADRMRELNRLILKIESDIQQHTEKYNAEQNIVKRSKIKNTLNAFQRQLEDYKKELAKEQRKATEPQEGPQDIDWGAVQRQFDQKNK